MTKRLESILSQFIVNTDVALRRLETSLEEFKDEMKAFKDEMNKRWGDLANKMGTLVEDIVAPNIGGVAKKYFGCEDFDFFAVRVRRRNTKDRSKFREFDVIAIWNDNVIINETKSNPRMEYINEFIDVLKEIYDYFPEYKDKKIIPIFSSLYLPEEVVVYLTKKKIYAMAMKDDNMDILNFDKVK
ncbi:MAG: hypothetical protein CBR30_03705 [Dictyoglomus sp. NZ13-RE01]|nr:MAG: hypothetical protein CBR30_03705 [Dictyoglomus sp. NZ13-RE01]